MQTFLQWFGAHRPMSTLQEPPSWVPTCEYPLMVYIKSSIIDLTNLLHHNFETKAMAPQCKNLFEEKKNILKWVDIQ